MGKEKVGSFFWDEKNKKREGPYKILTTVAPKTNMLFPPSADFFHRFSQSLAPTSTSHRTRHPITFHQPNPTENPPPRVDLQLASPF